ncbi:hypothetical protein QTP88_002792 [Uroleucon formosanum]
MAPGALQQRQMISSPTTTPQFSFTFNTNDNRASLPSGDAIGDITYQLTHTNSSPTSGESSPRVIKTHAEIRTDNYLLNINFGDLDRMRVTMHPRDMEKTANKYLLYVENSVKGLISGKFTDAQKPTMIKKLFNLMCLVSTIRELNNLLRNRFRDCGGTNLLIKNCVSKDPKLQYFSAKLLVECLDPGNLDYVVQHGLIKVMHVVQAYRSQEQSTVEQSIVSTGLLAKLFEHSESTCMRVIQLSGLDLLLAECRSRDTVIQRNCARALANLSLYGGPEVHNLMVLRHAHTWLFTLAFNTDVSVKYYALLAAAVLAADKTIEAAMVKYDTLDLIDPFVATHVPADLVGTDALGQGRRWLQRLVPILSCDRRVVHILAAFHFCAESEPSSQLRHGEISGTFRSISAVEPLKKLAGSLDDVTSGLAAQALRSIGEQVPRSLSQKVPLWTVEDVLQWTKSIGFGEWAERFVDNQMDGKWLLTLTEECLKKSLHNGILRKRFITDDQLAHKCGITNGIHRNVILNAIKDECYNFNRNIIDFTQMDTLTMHMESETKPLKNI